MPYPKLNFELMFIQLLKNKYIIKVTHINPTTIEITFKDGYKLYVEETFEELYQPYIYYVDKMPHLSIPKLYQEIFRMSNPITRVQPNSRQFKVFTFMMINFCHNIV